MTGKPHTSLLRTDFQGTGPPPRSGCRVCLLRCRRCRIEFAVTLLDPSGANMAFALRMVSSVLVNGNSDPSVLVKIVNFSDCPVLTRYLKLSE